jgi:hypothetical protein
MLVESRAKDGSAPAVPERCGLIMPISATDGCGEPHWLEVRSILSEAIVAAGFEPNLVSDAEEAGIIQKRIIQNLYSNPIVVCDVSGKNPNVMFELGMRLAFDKPTIIVKDDKTSYSFDTAPIEHLTYPRDLRYNQILSFKLELARKISATHRSSQADAHYTTFLKHFGTFTVARLREREVSRDEALFEELRELKAMVRLMRQNPRGQEVHNAGRPGHIVAKAMEFVAQYVAQHSIAASDLELRKGEIIQALEQKLFPQAHFDSLEEWKEFCDTIFAALPAKPQMRDTAQRYPRRALRET